MVVLIGAILSYRSVIRLGVHGVGGVNPGAVMAKVLSTDCSTGMIRVGFDKATSAMMAEIEYDKRAGYVGAFLAICGTLIWGYGDLLGLFL